jgi:hypothetical protein
MGVGAADVKRVKKKGRPVAGPPPRSSVDRRASQNSVWIVNWKVRGEPRE